MVGFITKRAMARDRWCVPVEQDEHGMFITLPKEFLDAYDWQPGDTITWTQKGIGEWEITNTAISNDGGMNLNLTD
jgi:hypothetical protein